MSNTLFVLVLGITMGVVLALLAVAALKPRFLRDLRRDAVRQSKAITRGQIYEQFATYFPGFDFNPKDAQFLGKPVDFVVFDGLDEGRLRRIVFVEVKTGASTLNTRERSVRDIIRSGAIEWREIRLGGAPSLSSSDRPAIRS